MVKDVEEIRKIAKQILEKFSSALEKVEEDVGEYFFEVDVDRRDEMEERREKERIEEEERRREFRKKMFANARKKDGDFIYAEKKTW